MVLQFFEKGFSSPPKNVQNYQWLSRKNMLICQMESYFENTWYCFLEEPMILLLVLK